MRRLTLALALAVLLPSTASAAVPAPPQAPTIVRAPCPGTSGEKVLGCAYVDRDAIERGLYGDECRDPNGCVYARDRATRTHELGHVFDAQVIQPRPGRVRRFTRLLGFAASTPWYAENRYRSPAERFADAYTLCARPLPRANQSIDTGYGWNPSRARLARVCRAIRALG